MLVGVGLERNPLAAAQAFIGGDDEGRVAVDDAAGQRIRREAAEHDRMDRADAARRRAWHRPARDHRHVDRDAIALPDAVLLQHVGEAADVLVELAVGDLPIVIGIVALPDDRRLVAPLLQVPVDAVVGDVEHAVLEPFDRDLAGKEVFLTF